VVPSEVPITGILLKAGGVALLWLLSVVPSSAAYGAPRSSAKVCGPQSGATSLRKLVRQLKALGGPLGGRSSKSRISLRTHQSYLQHPSHRLSHDDDDAIQNDAPPARFSVDAFVAPQRRVTRVETFEPRPSTFFAPPRIPRGPPEPV
jgi:hypothetical protein